MYNELEYANLYFEIISSIYENKKLDKNLIIAIASIDSLDKFSNLKTKEKAIVKLAMGNDGLEKFDNFTNTIIKQSQFLNVVRDVGVISGTGRDVMETVRENRERGETTPKGQLSGTGTDFLKGFLSYIPIVGGGIATYDIVKEMGEENPSYSKIAISSLIIASDAFILYSLATRDPKGAPIGFGGKVITGILKKIRSGLQITKVEQIALNKFGPSLVRVIDNMTPNIGRIIDKLPLSSAQKTKLKTNLPEEFKILKEKINARTTAGNIAKTEILETMGRVYGSIKKGKQTIYTTSGNQFIHVEGDIFLTPVTKNPNGTIREFNLVKLENVSGTGVREITGSASRAPDSIVARSEAAIDMMTNPKWKDPGLNINVDLLPKGIKKSYLAISSGGSATAKATTGIGAAGVGVGVGVGVAGGQAASSLGGAVMQGITPGGTSGALTDPSADAPGAY